MVSREGNHPPGGEVAPTMSKIYLASSWRNQEYPKVLKKLRAKGHQVYDFRSTGPLESGFAWDEVAKDWLHWTPREFIKHLNHPASLRGFTSDKTALDWADTCVLLLPCGRSAHLEAGYASGQGKRVIFLLRKLAFEPELMYLLGTEMVCSVPELIQTLKKKRKKQS